MDDPEGQLTQLRGELERALHSLRERSQTVHLDQAAVGRVSRVDALQQQAMAQAETARLEIRLKTVNNALKRIHEDRYGDCLRCGEPISEARLQAKPDTPFCVSCA